MKLHANAALSHRQRRRLVSLVLGGMTITATAALIGCSRQTASKWLGRWRRCEGLADRSSRPHRSPRRTAPAVEQALLRARLHRRLGPHPLGWGLGIAPSTVYAILLRHGHSRLPRPAREPIVRYQRQRPGELLHVDIKSLGAIRRRPDPRTGRLVGKKGRSGRRFLFVCVDDCSRLAYARLYGAETTANALDFLERCRRYYGTQGIEPERVLTDNGPCFKLGWDRGCRALAIQPRRTRPDARCGPAPRGDGEAEASRPRAPRRLRQRQARAVSSTT